MKVLKIIIAFAFGPFLAWVNTLLQPFQDAGLSHPHWANAANNLAIGLSAISTLVLVAILLRVSARAALFTMIGFGLFAVSSVFGVVWLATATEAANSLEEIEFWKEWWRWGYVTLLITLVLAAVSALHYLIQSDE